jgi:hypothetical protein
MRQNRHRRTLIRRLAVPVVGGVLGIGALGIAPLASGAATSAAPGRSGSAPQALLVGTYHGIRGQYSTIQQAVDAAKKGDWILIAPGDYHERDDYAHPPTAAAASSGDMAGLLINTPGLTLRGMNRRTVIIDGTKPGAPKACDSERKWQTFGVKGANGSRVGRNGIVVWKANDVSIENLTVCNFLSGSGAAGNEIWWNGGAGSGRIGLHGYWGRYLTATTTYFGGESTAAGYGIFSSDSAGPALWNKVYANNFNDSGMYVGACHQVCDIIIANAWMENNALGYSGTNSGGTVVIEHSQFDHNADGFDTNTQLNGDPPAPQDGRCPDGAISPITHTRSCWVFRYNYVHNNNNPSVPRNGSAAEGPTGTGMTISGGRFDTVEHNVFENNGAWGILFVPYPDSSPPSLNQTCAGTGGNELPGLGCVYDPEGDALLHNTFRHNGFFGNPSNSDFGQITLFGGQPRDCFAHNYAPDGSAPSNLEQIQPTCGPLSKGANTGGPLLAQVLCDTGFGSCPAGAHYPTPGKVILTSVPSSLPTMPNPCSGVPVNKWCPAGTGSWLVRHTPTPRRVPAASTGLSLPGGVLSRRLGPVALD